MENKFDGWISLATIHNYQAYSKNWVNRYGQLMTQNTARQYISKPKGVGADGHIEIRLLSPDGHTKTRVNFARLIAEIFVESRPSLAHDIAYRDNDRANCSADNLYWMPDPDIDFDADWQSIEGYENYEVSNTGQITSTSVLLQRRQLIKPYAAGARGDRAYVNMMRSTNLLRTATPLANVVAKHFLPPAPSANHFLWFRDGSPFNCAANNLYWTMRVELNLPMVDTDTGEEWRAMAEWPDYHVSSLGRLRRAVMTSPMDAGARMEKSYTYRARDRYISVNLTSNKRKHQVMVHHLVSEAFHGPKPTPQHFVWFIDGNSLNCRSDNLRWITNSEASQLADIRKGSIEEWRIIPFYDGYEASSAGRIRCLNRQQRRVHEDHALTPSVNRQGKLVVSVRKDGRQIPMRMHSLVAAAFLPPSPETYAFLRHINGDETDCKPDNLEWTTNRKEYSRRYKAFAKNRGS